MVVLNIIRQRDPFIKLLLLSWVQKVVMVGPIGIVILMEEPIQLITCDKD
jgi:hypothetical protein